MEEGDIQALLDILFNIDRALVSLLPTLSLSLIRTTCRMLCCVALK